MDSKFADSKTMIHISSDMPKETCLSFGEVLKKYREKNGVSQSELAGIFGLSRNSVTNWETDKSKPDFDTIKALAQMFGIPLYELFGLTGGVLPSPREDKMISQYRRLSAISQKIIDRMISNTFEEEMNARIDYLRENYMALPLYRSNDLSGPSEPYYILKRCTLRKF